MYLHLQKSPLSGLDLAHQQKTRSWNGLGWFAVSSDRLSRTIHLFKGVNELSHIYTTIFLPHYVPYLYTSNHLALDVKRSRMIGSSARVHTKFFFSHKRDGANLSLSHTREKMRQEKYNIGSATVLIIHGASHFVYFGLVGICFAIHRNLSFITLVDIYRAKAKQNVKVLC